MYEKGVLEDIFSPFDISDDDTEVRYEAEEAKVVTEKKQVEIYGEVDKMEDNVDPSTVNWFSKIILSSLRKDQPDYDYITQVEILNQVLTQLVNYKTNE